MDVLTSFAKWPPIALFAPEFNSTGELLIIGGRHPVIEELLRQKGERSCPTIFASNPGDSSYFSLLGRTWAASPRISDSPH